MHHPGVAWGLVGIIVVCTTVGDVLNTAGMKRQGEIEELSPRAISRMILRILHNPQVLGGMLFLAIAFFALLSLLTIADVSFAIPATALTYVFETFLAKHVLREDVNRRRWLAATLVACGVALLQW
jgi:drug/metabolite transporter (DMT)-like permease